MNERITCLLVGFFLSVVAVVVVFHLFEHGMDDIRINTVDFVERAHNDEPVNIVQLIRPNPLLSMETTDGVPVSTEDFECLRENIFFEARNQSERGQQAVAFITLNRVANRHYPNSICEVVSQGRRDANGNMVRNQCQFSWVCSGRPARANLNHPVEYQAWKRAGRIAEDVLLGNVENFIDRATHYHANYVNPGWSRSPRMQRVAVVDTHIFYNDRMIANALVDI